MLNISVVARRAAYVAVGLMAAACKDGAPVATEIESAATVMELAAMQARTEGDADAARVFDNASLAVRIGVRPTVIPVSVRGVVTRYRALVIGTVEIVGDRRVIRRRLVAWSGGDVRTAMLHVTTFGEAGTFSPPDRVSTTDDVRVRAIGRWFNLERPSRWIAVDGGAKLPVVKVGDPCQLADTRNDVRCAVAQFGVSVDGLFKMSIARVDATTDANTDVTTTALRIQTRAESVNGILIRIGDDPEPLRTTVETINRQ